MKHHLALSSFLLALAPALASAQGPAALFDAFDGGVNQGGWLYNGGDVLEPKGGNPTGWWHQPTADTVAPVIMSTNPALAGDWRAAGVDKLSFDARLLGIDFGDGSGFNMSVLLRDTKGTADVNDDDYAYTVGANIPLLGAGWKSFDFAVPSQDTAATPAGWVGGWVGDCCTFRPGVTWNDVITSVDRVEIWWMDPSFFALFQQWNIGLDNIAVQADGQATVRNGLGGNPLGYAATSTPDIGTSFTATVDLVTPGHPLSVVALSLGGAAQGVFPGGGLTGELLVQPNLFAIDIKAGSHAFPIPLDPAFFGLQLATQGGSIAPSGQVHLNNAIDLVIGG